MGGGGIVRIYKKKLDILLSFDCIKVILKYCLFFFNSKKKIKKTSEMRVEQGAFGSVAGVLPIELHGNISFMQYLIKIKIENILYGLWENFYIEFHRNSQQAFAYIIFSILSGD